MKKLLINLKTLLVVALLGMGTSAWASSFPKPTLTIYTDDCSSTSTYTTVGNSGGVYAKTDGYGTSTNCLQVSKTGYFDLKSVNSSLPENLTNTILTFYMKPKASGAGYIAVYPSSVSPSGDSSNELLKLAITSAAGTDDGEATVSINGTAYGTTLTGNVYYKVEIDMKEGTYSIVNTSTSATFASGDLANYTSLSDTQLGGIFIKNPLDTRIDEISVKCDYTWTGVTPFSESYTSTSETTGWSTKNSGRYDPAILSEGEDPSTNYYMSVNQGQRDNNGTTVTGTILNGKAIAGADFTLTFDLRLVSSNDQWPTSFTIKDAANSGTIFSLSAMYKNETKWQLNGTSHHVTLPGSKDNPAINTVTWCSCQVTRSNGFTWIKITNKSNDEVIFAQSPVKSSATGGLGDMVFVTSRKNSNFAIDNIVVRDVEDGDIEDEKTVYTYDINAVAGGTTIKTIESGVGVQGSTFKTSIPKVILYNDKYYILDDDDNTALTGYKASYTKAASNETKEINYSLDEGIVYFTEGEAIATSVTVDDETSGGKYASYKQGVTTVNLTNGAGKYRMDTDVKGRASSNPLYVYSDISSSPYTSIGEISKNGVTGERSTESFTLAENSTIYVGLEKNNSLSFDYVIIRKAPVSYTVEYKCGATTIKTADASRTAVWGTTVTLPSTDKVDIIYGGKLYRYTSDDASSQLIASDGTTVITVNFEEIGTVATMTYTLNVGTSASTTISSSTTTTDETDISSVAVDQSKAAGDGAGAASANETGERTTKLPIKTGANGATFDSPTNYVLFKFTVAADKKFTPSDVTIKVANVGSSSANNIKYKATLSDNYGNSLSNTYVVTTQDGSVETFHITNTEGTDFIGAVSLKLWAWTIASGDGKGSAFRMGSPVTISGLVNDMSAVEIAIADCKSYETSSAFKTYIDGLMDAGSLTTAAEVYTAHTAWQVENGTPSKAILNNTVTSADHFWGTLGDDADYTGAPDTKYLYNTAGSAYNVNQIVYQLPAGVYRASAWTYSSIAGWRKIYISKVPDAGAWDDLITPETSDEGWVELSGEFTLTEPANIAFGLYASAVAGRVAGFDNWTLTQTGVPVTVSAAGFATYVNSTYDLDFTSTSIKAYKVKVSSKGIAKLTKVDEVPAGTPVLLYKDGGDTENIPVMTGAAAVSDNDLVAGTGAAVATTDGEYTNMILNNVSGIGFYFANGQTVAKNRAYLHIATSLAPTAASRMVMVFGDETTGVNSLTPNPSPIGDGSIYTLSGQRVENPKKGLYIKNGKKVVIK